MSFFHAVVLGAVQGLTEFLPVSSSGHLILLPQIFGWTDQGLAFDVIVHLGTLLAVVVFFREKIWEICRGFVTGQSDTFEEPRNLGWLLLLATIPAGAIGFLYKDIIESVLRTPLVVGVSFIVWGVVLGVADRFNAKKTDQKTLSETTWKDALLVGLAQAIALIPGTSRSGITMTAGLFVSLSKTAAAELSFLMSIPIIGSAGILKLYELIQTQTVSSELSFLVVGFIFAAISAFLAIWGLMRVIKKWNYLPFVGYRIIVGLLILAVM
jgi:undecaprenyl-diphosphatase